MKALYEEMIELLKQLISIESFSQQEHGTASAIAQFLNAKNIPSERLLNNVWAKNKHYDPLKPTILLNSHHDTVKPNLQYTRDPFVPSIENGRLYGLGSNDAGGPLVALLGCFLHYYPKPALPFNLIWAATAEEEVSGDQGVAMILPLLGDIYFGVVGEPTRMDVAIAEKGLLVVDCIAHGKAGHAAREEGENAIYKAMHDIQWFQSFEFPKISPALGKVKMSVTQIQAGTQHNVVPASCTFTVDIRNTDQYSNNEILEVIRKYVSSEVVPRSVKLNPSSISVNHPMVLAAKSLGCILYGSPTTSDQALMPFDTFKMGPGDSARSHAADEYIGIQEIIDGIDTYIQLLTNWTL